MMQLEDLKEIFAKVFPDSVNIASVTETADLRQDLGMNSIGLLYMAMVLEEKYGVRFSNTDLEKMHTVADVLAKIEGRI